MKKIEAKIICDSINKQGNRVTTMLLTFPRFILPELNTHRVFSKNSASSRAIPFKKMLESVQNDPFIPIAWQTHHSGMQGNNYLTNEKDISWARQYWIDAAGDARKQAITLDGHGVSKQITNRILEPFLWHTVLLTATEFTNFFKLRCPKYKVTGLGVGPQKSKKDWLKYMQFSSTISFPYPPTTIEDWLTINESGAEIHMQALAESMWDAMNESTPKLLSPREYHAPYQDQIEVQELGKITNSYNFTSKENIEARLKICIARCARLSYMTQDNKIDYQKDIELYDRLLESGHFSPFEHVCRCMTDEEYYTFVKGRLSGNTDEWGILHYEYYPLFTGLDSCLWFEQEPGENKHNGQRYGWCNNFRGFIQQRYLLENECK